MSQAVRFTEFGGPEVLEVVEVPTPQPGPGEVLVEVYAAGLNPLDSAIRRGAHPAGNVALPSGQGFDLAGVVLACGEGASRFDRGDEVMGFAPRTAQATHAVVPEAMLIRRPAGISWEVAGSLATAGTVAWNAVEHLSLGLDDVVVITSAAGGLGCLAAQFARLRGAAVIGTGVEMRHDFLRQFGVIPTDYGPGLADRVRAITDAPITAFCDFLGGEEEAAAALDVSPWRIRTLFDEEPGDVVALDRVAAQIAARRVRLPIADVFPLGDIVDAYRALDRREAPGKIVVGMHIVSYPGQRVHEPAIKEQDVTIAVPSEHQHLEAVEAVPAAIGDGSVRRRHRAAREAAEAEGRS